MPNTPQPLRAAGWTTIDVLRAAALVFGLWYVLKLLWFAQALLFTVFLGVLFGLAVSEAARRLKRFGIPRGVAAPLVVLGFVGLLVGIGALSAPVFRKQASELREKLPEGVDKVRDWLDRRVSGVSALVGGAPAKSDSTAASTDTTKTAPSTAEDSTQSARGPMGGLVGNASQYAVRIVHSTVAIVAGTLLILVLSIYIGANPDLYHNGIMHLFPHRARPRAAEVLSAIADNLRRWLVAQLIAMIVVSLVVMTILLILHVRAAIPLGIIAGLFEFIPTIGPVMSAVPGVSMAFLDSPQKALIVLIVYWAVQFMENHLLVPLLMRRGLNLPPALTIVAQATMALLFGFLGLIVAVPVLAATTVAVRMIYVEQTIGDVVDSSEPVRP